jgi:hypothetical protein
MDSIKRAVVAAFLKGFKMLAERDKGIYIVNRREHADALAELEITEQDRLNEILSLSVENYSSGPEPDRDRAGEVWKFGKEINGHEVHIKLKIAETGDRKIAKCISFHKAKHAQKYPLR